MHNLLTSVGTRDNINDLVTPRLDTTQSSEMRLFTARGFTGFHRMPGSMLVKCYICSNS
jgi:hypothetical protein